MQDSGDCNPNLWAGNPFSSCFLAIIILSYLASAIFLFLLSAADLLLSSIVHFWSLSSSYMPGEAEWLSFARGSEIDTPGGLPATASSEEGFPPIGVHLSWWRHWNNNHKMLQLDSPNPQILLLIFCSNLGIKIGDVFPLLQRPLHWFLSNSFIHRRN